MHWIARTAALAAVGVLVCLTTSAAQAQRAQPSLDDDAYVAFGRRDGLPDAAILSLQPTTGGRLLLATSDGARLFDGRRWVPLAPPPTLATEEFRVILDRANGDRVFVSSFGLVVQRGAQASPIARIGDAAVPVYSAVAAPKRGGGDEVLIGAAGGVFLLDSADHLVPLPLPDGMPATGAMLTARLNGAASELWVGTQGGGVARRRDGIWTHWGAADGLTSPMVEHVSLAPIGDTLTALAATPDGAFALRGNRWVAIGPRVSITRVLRVRVGLHYETWLGAFGGELYRSTDDRDWRLVDITARIRGSRTQVLTAIDHGLGHPTIYAAFRSGTLLRFRIGLAGRVGVPAAMIGHSTLAVSSVLDDGGFWTWVQGIGAVRMPEVREMPSSSTVLAAGDGRVRLRVHRSDDGEAMYAAVEGRVYRYRDTTWQRLLDWGASDYVHTLVSAFGPGRRPGLVAITTRGAAVVYDDGAIEPWIGFPAAVRVLLEDRTTTPSTLLAVRADRQIERFDGRRWTPVPGSPVPLTGTVSAARMLRLRSGECALLVGASTGLAMLRTCGGAPAWQLVNDGIVPALRSNEVTDLATLSADATAVGTAQGVTFLYADSTFRGGIRLAHSVTDADGLPHASVMALGPIDAARRLWVGTTLGLGFINTTEVERPRVPVRITELEMRDVRGEPVADGARIPEGSARLDVSVIVPTHHREDETQYRFELDGVPLHPSPWTEQSTMSLVGVAAGAHTLRVLARDFDGRESVALERRFTVERPWWRSPTAGLVYLALAGAGVFGWVRSRTQAARRRALEAEENERRVAISESRFRRLFEDGTDPQILVLDGSIWQLNAAADTLLTHDGVDLRSQPVDSVIDGLTARLNADASVGRWDLEARGPAGPIPVEVRRTRIPLDGAVLDHLELSDLREQRRLEAERAELEAQLREAQRLESVGTLAGGVAHDFNNLLTVIHTNAELAAADVPATSAAGESLTQLLVASRRAREVVRQILTFSRRTRTHRSAVRIDALLTETQSLLRAMIPSTVQIVFRDDAPGAVVEGDATQLQQLLLNLCSNAEYAMRATNGGTLTVQARWEDHAPVTAVRLSVTDTGVGIPAEVRARMFEPFFTTKPVGEGTGLGLSVLHGIVGAHGGTIAVTSELGHGSTFDVVLPARHADQAVSHEPPAMAPAAAATRRILLVDDEPAVMRAVQRTLQRRGYEVETASNGAEALERLRTRQGIDLVITDQTMPVMTGTELIEQLRADGLTVPVILASGFGAAVDRVRNEGSGDVWRMDKPFATEELLAMVARAMAGDATPAGSAPASPPPSV